MVRSDNGAVLRKLRRETLARVSRCASGAILARSKARMWVRMRSRKKRSRGITSAQRAGAASLQPLRDPHLDQSLAGDAEMGGAGVEAFDHPFGEVDVDPAGFEIRAPGAGEVKVKVGGDALAGVEGAVELLSGYLLYGAPPPPSEPGARRSVGTGHRAG
jgi:hypothetical protein